MSIRSEMDALMEAGKPDVLLLVYGTLRAGHSKHHLLGDSKFKGISWANDLEIKQAAGGKAAVRGNGKVEGELYLVPTELLLKLDRYESPEFERRAVRLHNGRAAQTYILVK